MIVPGDANFITKKLNDFGDPSIMPRTKAYNATVMGKAASVLMFVALVPVVFNAGCAIFSSSPQQGLGNKGKK